MICECCRSFGASKRLWLRKYEANLCERCAGSGHYMGQCIVCMTDDGLRRWYWSCAMTAHAAEKHQALLHAAERMAREEDAKQVPVPYTLGRVRF